MRHRDILLAAQQNMSLGITYLDGFTKDLNPSRGPKSQISSHIPWLLNIHFYPGSLGTLPLFDSPQPLSLFTQC